MIIHDFTQIEIDYLLEKCNFTSSEQQLFLLRAKNTSLTECSFIMNMSVDGIKKISRKVNTKIIKSL